MRKKCTQCGKRQDLSKFYKDRNSYKNRCKSCMSTKKTEDTSPRDNTENIPYMRVNANNRRIEKETGLILSGIIELNGQAIPVFLKEYDKEKLYKIEAIPVRRVEC